MCSFVEYLTTEMHRCTEHAEVVWYDSVTRDGELKWQKELNDHNRCHICLCVLFHNFLDHELIA